MAGDLRWRLADEPTPQTALFNPALRVTGKGEFRGLEFLEVDAKTIVNKVPGGPRFGFEYTINPYRGCSHACIYCLAGDTPILMADLSTKRLADVRPGDRIIGTRRLGRYRRWVETAVVDHWRTVRRAYRVRTQAGTSIVASGDHRFMTDRGWKHVVGAMGGPDQRPYLTPNNRLVGFGPSVASPKHSHEYKVGYLTGMIRGDANLARYNYLRSGRRSNDVYRFRLALADHEALDRSQRFLNDLGVQTDRFMFSQGSERSRPLIAIRSQKKATYLKIKDLVAWPRGASKEWAAGFLGGIFDAVGSSGGGADVVRIANRDEKLVQRIEGVLADCGFDTAVDRAADGGVRSVRFRGGISERVRFMQLADPAISRKRTIAGAAVKTNAPLHITSVVDLGVETPMYDITTGTGDFVADGVISHNCFARPTHEYLGLGIGEDFDRKIVVKRNAVELAEVETSPSRWGGDLIAMGTNTDPYQPAEGKYRLTRGILGVLSKRRNPISILTKSSLVLRDIDVLEQAVATGPVSVAFSVGTLDTDVWKLTEPGTPHPMRRIEAVSKLKAAGIPASVLMGPVIPGLSDSPEQLEEVVRAAVAAGADSIGHVVLHLGAGVKEHWLDWLADNRPDLLAAYRHWYRRGREAPARDRARIAETIRALIDAHGGPTSERPQPTPHSAKSPKLPTQLTLGT